jgi:hypothetical protein
MIRLSALKPGDIVMTEFEGQRREGVVTDLNREDGEVCVETDVQEFWFTPDHLFPIELSDEQLRKLGFTRQDNPDGSAKYMKGSFRVLLPRAGDFSEMEIWWREDHRHLHGPLYVHELQNHYLQMTKVELTPA